MKNKILISAIATAVLVLMFFVCRESWLFSAYSVANDVESIMNTPATDPGVFINSLSGEVSRLSLLSRTCLVLLRCTPGQQESAIKIVEMEKRRIDAFKEYAVIREKALAVYNAGDIETLKTLEQPYYAAKEKVKEINTETHLAVRQLPLPIGLRPAFEALQ